jgi:type I restriction enzyme S subunit
MKYLCSIGNGKDYSHIQLEEGGYPVLGTGGEFARCSDYLYEGPSVLLGRKGTIDNPLYINEPFWTSDTLYYTIIRPSVLPMFLYHSVHQIPFDEYEYGSTIPSMTKTQYENMRFPLPPLPEQEQIVSFLDEKTSKIDDLIKKKEQKIELLKEYRTSLINRVITKGLNPDVPMKDSGVEWIGEVPSHWEMRRVGYLSSLLTGNPWSSDLFDHDSGLKIVRGENVSEGFLRWGERTRYWKYDVIKGDTYYLNEDDIVVSMDGSKVGKNYVRIKRVDLPLLLHQRMCRIRIVSSILPRFLEFYIGSSMFHYYIDISKTDPMIPHITQKNISDLSCPLPPLPEQEQIVSYLDGKTGEIDSTIDSEKKKIDLLKEYRQSLISSVITGKIKVVD